MVIVIKLCLGLCLGCFIAALTLNVPIPDKKKKSTKIFILTLLCGTSKDFMKAFKKCENKNFS